MTNMIQLASHPHQNGACSYATYSFHSPSVHTIPTAVVRGTFSGRIGWREANTYILYDKYAPVVGTGTAQQLIRKNGETWESFEELDADPDEDPGLPGYWGNRDDGYPLRGVVRQDLYEINWNSNGSTIEIPVGKALNEKYDIPGRRYRVTLELRGDPRWSG